MTKSRKVMGYIKAHVKWEKSRRKTKELENDVMTRFAALTGGQIAEVRRILGMAS